MRADDQVVFSFLNDQVVDGHARQVLVEHGKRRSCVGGEVGASIRAHDPPARAVCAFDQGVDRFVRQVLSPIFPGFPRVTCRKHHGVQAVVPVAVEGHHQQVGVVLGPAHLAHPKVLEVVAFARLGGQRQLQATPRVPAVGTDVDQPVVAARGQHAKLRGMFREGRQGSKGHVSWESTSCQVVASRLKRVSAVE